MSTERPVDARVWLERRNGPLTFGRMLRALRLCDELTLAVYATRLGVTKQHLSDVERGRRAVSVERAAAWATTLGYSPEQFVRLALQAQVEAAKLPYAVTLVAKPRRRGRQAA